MGPQIFADARKFFEKDLTYAVLGAATEGHRERRRLLVGIQEPGFEPGGNLRKSC